MTKDYLLETAENDKISITAYGFEDIENKPCLIFVHGFKGFKDWGFGPHLAGYFADKGFFVVTFNFSHNGVGYNKLEFTELDKFAQNSFSKEVKELTELINAYSNNFFGKVNNNKVGLIGHSRGGAIALLAAFGNDNVKAVATWAAISKFDRYSERQKTDWRKNGFFEVLNSRTNQLMRLNVSLLEDIEKYSDSLLNIENAAKFLDKPWLLAHGDQDLTVPVKEAEKLYKWSNKNLTELYVIHSTGHTFNITHPFNGSNEKFENLLNKTNHFFSINLI